MPKKETADKEQAKFRQLNIFLKHLDESGYEQFFENPFLGICIANQDGKVLKVNDSHARITGIPQENFVGRNLVNMEEERIISESATLKVIKSQEEEIFEQKLSNGRAYMVKGEPIFDDKNRLRFIVSYLLDISELQNLKVQLKKVQLENQQMHAKLNEFMPIYGDNQKIIYKSKKMKDIIELSNYIADSDATVLITGDSGVGKELIAKLIHEKSTRKDRPFVKINCGAIPENLLESELFGYEPGAFTGGSKNGKKGLFEEADEGTILLDEIGELPLNLQVKLLRILQEYRLRRLGGTKDFPIDIRVIAATNADLNELIREKRFRKDLYYRLNVIPIEVPSLKDRKEDIPLLIYHFIDVFNKKYDKNKKISLKAVEYFMEIELEGNIRQLENTIERLVLLSEGETIKSTDLYQIFPQQIDRIPHMENEMSGSLNERLERYEKAILRESLDKYKSTYKIAEVLQINQSTVSRKIAKYGLRNKK